MARKPGTIATVQSWADGQHIKFVRDGKLGDSASGQRYQKYQSARTVKAALERGALPADLYHDYERGLVKPVKGSARARKRPASAVTRHKFRALAQQKSPAGPTAVRSTKWKPEQRISFVKDAKERKTASGERYHKYQAAKTIQEAMNLGALHADLRFDYIKGLMKLEGRASAPKRAGALKRPAAAACRAFAARRKFVKTSAAPSRADDETKLVSAPSSSKDAAAEVGTKPSAPMDDSAILPGTLVEIMTDGSDDLASYGRVVRTETEEQESIAIVQRFCCPMRFSRLSIKDLQETSLEKLESEAVCNKCSRAEPVDQLLLCDNFAHICLNASHTHCLVPSVASTPKGSWLCESCSNRSPGLPSAHGINNLRHLAATAATADDKVVANPEVVEPDGPVEQKDTQLESLFADASALTKAQWATMQEGMDEKWPAPDYMAEDVGSTRSSMSFRDETYMAITRWTAETLIEYRPHAKAPGSKSFCRYEQYSKAKTVGEALALGSMPADWCWDFERGFLKVNGGPLREEPLDPLEEHADITDVDRVTMRWFKREAARMLGTSLKELQERDKKWCGNLLMHLKRSVVDRKCKKVLQDCSESGVKVSDCHISEILRAWVFDKNSSRANVIPEGQEFVYSDTVGLVSIRDGRCVPSAKSLDYPNFIKLLCTYLKDNLPPDAGAFHFTSININKNYAARRHRDGGNVGLSMIKAFGDFNGGNLRYFCKDDRSCKDVEQLSVDESTELDLSKHLTLFDGKRAHEVIDFDGERFTLVWFTCARYEKASAQDRAKLQKCGIPLPKPKQVAESERLLQSASSDGPHCRTWLVS